MSFQRSRLPTGISSLDRLLGGGFHTQEVNLVYGEATTGKTTLSLTTVFHHLRVNQSAMAVYLDIDNKLNAARLEQIASSQGKNLLKRIRLFTPESYSRQGDALEQLPEVAEGDLVVIDSITGLYRGETEGTETTFRVNRELNRQLGYLLELAKTTGSTVLLTGQVRSRLDSGVVEPVAERLLRYWSSVILRLEDSGRRGTRIAILEKPEDSKTPIILTINESGMTEEQR